MKKGLMIILLLVLCIVEVYAAAKDSHGFSWNLPNSSSYTYWVNGTSREIYNVFLPCTSITGAGYDVCAGDGGGTATGGGHIGVYPLYNDSTNMYFNDSTFIRANGSNAEDIVNLSDSDIYTGDIHGTSIYIVKDSDVANHVNQAICQFNDDDDVYGQIMCEGLTINNYQDGGWCVVYNDGAVDALNCEEENPLILISNLSLNVTHLVGNLTANMTKYVTYDNTTGDINHYKYNITVKHLIVNESIIFYGNPEEDGGDNGIINYTPDLSGGILSLGSANVFRVPDLANCDTIDTDADGILSCGTDGTGSGADYTVIQNGSSVDCVEGNYSYGRYLNGTWKCRADSGGSGSDTWATNYTRYWNISQIQGYFWNATQQQSYMTNNITASDLRITDNISGVSTWISTNKTEIRTNINNNATKTELNLRANLAGNKTEIGGTITANATKTELNLRANLAGNKTEIQGTINTNLTLAATWGNNNMTDSRGRFMNVSGGSFTGAFNTSGKIQLNDKINMSGRDISQANCINFTNGFKMCIGSN